jgi:hypothetical protein
MKESFGDLLSNSWNEYKLNFKVIFKLFLYFVIIPGIVLLLFQIYGIYNLDILSVESEQNPFSVFAENSKHYITFLVLSLFIGLLSFLAYISITCGTLKGKKFSFSEALHEGKKNYWRSIGFLIVLGIFLTLLFMLFVIPGIIFAVYWAFAYYVFLAEKKGIIDSLKDSYNMVKGKWWKTFGYCLLIMLVIFGISLIFAIPSSFLNLINFLETISGAGAVSKLGRVILGIVSFVFSVAGQLITTPLLTIFMKNFYLGMNKGSK